eukprot:TRINITY_DN18519_c0_g1_i1.p1 TRINITY_DN18519_c0_g1~~TRINITY_DN18519_c0_g1_i1.p1  ORF type:complete len:704 (-),score=262.10 TRINITY_DN18519_c0_g1_i1:143-2254(-)
MASVADSDTMAMEESLNKTKELSQTIHQWLPAHEEFDKRLSSEVKSHKQTKERIKTIENDFHNVRSTLDKEIKGAASARAQLEDKERINTKAQESLKALADDLVSVRLQNEALRAEMEVQRKAFVVHTNWASRHAELKSKYEKSIADLDKARQNLEAQNTVEVQEAVKARDAAVAAERSAASELEEFQKLLQTQQEKLGFSAPNRHEVEAQLAEMEILKRQIMNDKEKRAKQKEKMRAQLLKSLNQGADTLCRMVMGSWSQLLQQDRKKKAKSAQGQASAMRAIANSSLAVMDFCFTAWQKDTAQEKQNRIKEAQRALEEAQDGAGAGAMASRQKALAQLEKQFGNKDAGLLREVMAKWPMVRVERLRKEKSMAMAGRSIAQSGNALVAHCFGGWAKELQQQQAKREKKASGQSRAMRMIADGDNALQDFCLTQWAGLTKKAKATKKQKEQGNVKAARMIACKGKGLTQQIVFMWREIVKTGKQQKRKVQMVQRQIGSSATTLLAMVVNLWEEHAKDEMHKKNFKMKNMNASQAAMLNTGTALLMQVFGILRKEAEDAKNAKLREALKNVKPITDVAALEAAQEEKDRLNRSILEMNDQIAKEKASQVDINAELDERERVLRNLDKKLSDIKREITESRKKAREINDELCKVGLLLQSPPARKTSPKEQTALPSINGGSARPMSGKKKLPSGQNTPTKKSAWE